MYTNSQFTLMWAHVLYAYVTQRRDCSFRRKEPASCLYNRSSRSTRNWNPSQWS
jgi:hypothetical protein